MWNIELLQIFIFELVQYTFCCLSALRSSGRISSNSAFCSSLAISSSAIFIYQTTNDVINLRPIPERINSTFPKMTILSVQIQGYIARLFSIKINRKIFITILHFIIIHFIVHTINSTLEIIFFFYFLQKNYFP